MSEPNALQVKDTGVPVKKTMKEIEDETPVAKLPEIPHNVTLDKTIQDSDMVDIGKRHMFALLDHSAKTQNMNIRANMRLHLEIANAVVSAGHTGIKLAQEAESAGLVADGAALLTNIFMNVRSTVDNPLVSKEEDGKPRDIDIGETPEDFVIKPGEIDTGTCDLDPEEFKDQLEAPILTGID